MTPSVAGFAPRDCGSLVGLSGPAIEPSGSQVAYVVTRGDDRTDSYRSAIWTATFDEGTPAVQVTPDDVNEMNPVWSPDGRRLAFTRAVTTDGVKAWELRVRNRPGSGESVLLSRRPEPIRTLEWSPDGQWLLFCSRDRDASFDPSAARKITSLDNKMDGEGNLVGRPRQMWATAAAGAGPTVRLTHAEAESFDGTFSPNGDSIVFVSARHPNSDLDKVNALWRMPFHPWSADAVESTRLTEADGIYALPSFNAEGTALAYYLRPGPSRARPGHHHAQVCVLDLQTGNVEVRSRHVDRNLTSYAGTKRPTWVGTDLLTLAEDHGDVPLLRLAADGSSSRLVGGPRTIAAFDVSADGDALAYICHDLNTEPMLWLGRVGAERAVDLPRPPRPRLPYRQFAVTSEDGCSIDAWLLLPPGTEFDGPAATLPVVLMIHGGPATQYGNQWLDEFHVMANAGFAVLFCNPHGASGQSELFARSVMSPRSDHGGTGWGGIDYRDVMTVLDTALERYPMLDGARAGVIGGSYGGYLTTWIVSHTDRFAAACSERAANDVLSMDGTSDTAGRAHLNHGVDPFNHADELRRLSPMTYVQDIHTPLLILHSDHDLRCPPEQADRLFSWLRQLGREVEYWRFPNEGHELSRSGTPRHRIHRAEIIAEWFDRWLRPQTPAPSLITTTPEPSQD